MTAKPTPKYGANTVVRLTDVPATHPQRQAIADAKRGEKLVNENLSPFNLSPAGSPALNATSPLRMSIGSAVAGTGRRIRMFEAATTAAIRIARRIDHLLASSADRAIERHHYARTASAAQSK